MRIIPCACGNSICVVVCWLCGHSSLSTNQSSTNDTQMAPLLTNVFTNGEANFTCFFAPSLVATPTGALLAFAEGRGLRLRGCHDVGDVLIAMKRSFDDGRTWSNLSIVADGYWQGAKRVGNAAPVADHRSGEVVLVYQNVTTTACQIMTMRTNDEGATWSAPVDITASTRVNGTNQVAVGPPGGVQLRSGADRGRLVVCAEGHTGSEPLKGSYALMSDDGGSTWSSGQVVRGCMRAGFKPHTHTTSPPSKRLYDAFTPSVPHLSLRRRLWRRGGVHERVPDRRAPTHIHIHIHIHTRQQRRRASW